MGRSVGTADLLQPFTSSYTASEDARLGVELEAFPVCLSAVDLAPSSMTSRMQDVLRRLVTWYDWCPQRTGSESLAFIRAHERLVLRPGGAIAYTSPRRATVWELEHVLEQFLTEWTTAAQPLDTGLLALGYHPLATPETDEAMRRLTCSTHVTMTFASEADAMRKLQLASKLTPFFIALSANSAVQAGQETGRASTRAYAWMGLDPARAGFPDWIFQPQARFADYVTWALEAPLTCVERHGKTIRIEPCAFRDFLAHGLRLPHGGGYTTALLADWQQHLTTLCPWVRLRQAVEIRAFDSAAPNMVLAYVALVKGLFTSPRALRAVEELVGAYDQDMLQHLLHQATLYGLEADAHGIAFADMLGILLSIARDGLAEHGHQEDRWLTPCAPQACMRRTAERRSLASVDMAQYMYAHLLTPEAACQGALT